MMRRVTSAAGKGCSCPVLHRAVRALRSPHHYQLHRPRLLGSATTHTVQASAKELNPRLGPLRSLPRWEAIGNMFPSPASSSAARWNAGRETRLREFGHSKQWKTLSEIEANQLYHVRRRDLEGKPFVAKYNVFGAPKLTRFYVLFDVQDAALRRWGSSAAIKEALAERRAKRQRRISRLQPPVLMLLRPVRARKGTLVVGSRAITAAIVGNTGVLCAKLVGWAHTGSASLLSEAMHSAADLGNQVLLGVGLQQSMRRADETRPYGYGFEVYVWAMISGVSTFILGAGASVYHGLQALASPQPLESLPTALGVLATCAALESYTLGVAWREIGREAAKLDMSPLQYLRRGPDPLNTAVFLEDSVAVVGVGIAGSSIALTQLTGNPVYDAVGSIGVGGLMGTVALFIIDRNRRSLGHSVPERTSEVVSLLQKDEMVLSVQDVKSVLVGPQTARFKAEIHFNPQLLTQKYLNAHSNMAGLHKSLSDATSEQEVRQVMERYGSFLLATLSVEVDRLEHMIQSDFPEFRYIDLEVL